MGLMSDENVGCWQESAGDAGLIAACAAGTVFQFFGVGFIGLTEVMPLLQNFGVSRGGEARRSFEVVNVRAEVAAEKSGFESRFTNNIPRGLKPSVYFQPLAARLKQAAEKSSFCARNARRAYLSG